MERADETNAWHAVEIRQEKEHCDARDWQLELNNGEEFYSPEVAFRTPARVLISGLSAEKLLEGFSRHRSAFLTTSLSSDDCDRLLDELKMNLERIWTQNLGRDEQIMSWFFGEVRLVIYLAEILGISHCNASQSMNTFIFFTLGRNEVISKVRDHYRSQAVRIWKAEFITKNDGKLLDWKGSWRRSFIHKFIIKKKLSNDNECTESEEDKGSEEVPTNGIRINGIYSDVLFQPILCSTFSIQRLYNSGKRIRSGRSTQIKRISGCDVNHYRDLGRTPTVLTNLMDSWKCYRPRSDDILAKDSNRTKAWTFELLIERYPGLNFRAEASLTNLIDYRAYHDHCERDESPVYLFDH
ncbi:hypothetical protein PPACK8108_LOCUS849 [Phakopsora pachyrhizi]|uniref:Uncharacterized protein n=1 Tax=Phakopsora pachyrhizi TaxID=170000 RepID=A0AAV0AEK1_PHAPC|nr:hypothetical protein PPACK8108_LOCUS849 [Phakopsora pachyrhizi]